MPLPALIATIALVHAPADDPARPLARIRVADDRRGFVLADSGKPFVPWGFNYDRDENGRLLEDYWEADWPKVVEDFHEMKELGANVVRVHLQFGKFFPKPDAPDEEALARLGKLLELAESERLYLDLTGLGCYRKKDVPAWYGALDEKGRWAAQAKFWRAVAGRCARSPAVFCYDLMNEPVVPGGKRAAGDWLGPPFGEFHYVQVVTLDQADRPRPEVARLWIETLAKAVRAADPGRMVTVGLVDWSLDRPGLSSGFVPEKVAGPLDFVCVHLYPEKGKVAEALDTLRGFAAAGKPVVIEETFPLKCGGDEFRRFLDDSSKVASGLVGFYWGKTADECRRSGTIGDAFTLDWLNAFHERAGRATRP